MWYLYVGLLVSFLSTAYIVSSEDWKEDPNADKWLELLVLAFGFIPTWPLVVAYQAYLFYLGFTRKKS